MNKKLLFSFLMTISLFLVVGCNTVKNNSNNEIDNSNEVVHKVKAIINEKEYINDL